MARVIPKEHLAAYQRWQANPFGAAERTTPERTPAPAGPAPETGNGEQVELLPGLPTAEQIEQSYEQARQEGFQQGYAEGMQAAEAELADVRQQALAQAALMLDNFRQALAALDEVVGEQTLNLALEVASRVIGSTVQVRPDLLVPIMHEAIQALPIHHGTLGIHVNPAEIERLREHMDELASQSALQLVPDSSVAAGGFLLKAGNSEVDAQLETRWRRVLEAIGVDPERWLIS